MQSKWKKAFVAATICVALGIVLMTAGFFAVGCDFRQLNFSIVFDETGLVMPEPPDVPDPPDAPVIPAAPEAPSAPKAS